jgi:hypothetical protein
MANKNKNKQVFVKLLPEEAKPHVKDSAMCFQIEEDGYFIEFATGTLEEVFDKLPTIFGNEDEKAQLQFSYHQHGVIKVFAPAFKCYDDGDDYDDVYVDVGRILYGEENVKLAKGLQKASLRGREANLREN